MKKRLVVLVCAFVVLVLTSGLQAETRKYIKIGGDPHPAVAGKLLEGEKSFSLPRDLQVLTVGGSGYEYIGWLHAGEILVVKGDRVVRIKKCGNPVYSFDGKTIRMEDFQTVAAPTPRQEYTQQEDMYEYVEVSDQPQRYVSQSSRQPSTSVGRDFFQGFLGEVGPSAMVVAGVQSRNGSKDAWAWGVGSVLTQFLTGGTINARYIGETVGQFGIGYVGGSTKTKTRNRVVYIHSDPDDSYGDGGN